MLSPRNTRAVYCQRNEDRAVPKQQDKENTQVHRQLLGFVVISPHANELSQTAVNPIRRQRQRNQSQTDENRADHQDWFYSRIFSGKQLLASKPPYRWRFETRDRPNAARGNPITSNNAPAICARRASSGFQNRITNGAKKLEEWQTPCTS